MDTTTQDVVVFPTSFAQRRLWFLDQVVGAEPVYHVVTEVEFDWAVTDAHFVEALALLGRRHDALRTTFALVDGEPMQVVHDRVTIPCAVYDLGAVASDDRDDRLEDIARTLGEAPFDLAQGPLLRTALVRFSSDSSVAVLIAHHIITDGWSSDLL